MMPFSPERTLYSTLSNQNDVLNQEVNNVIWANTYPAMEHTTHGKSAPSGIRTGAGQGTTHRRYRRHAGKTDRAWRQSRSGR
ncbi:protein of unknown function [Enterobacter cancerogenus]|nr:protein of unknown function [Enterobacter cancerogenus]